MEPFTFFISYRRDDTGPIALLLKYEIEKRLQFVRAFVDVEDIGSGQNFPDRIAEMIGRSHVTIALIGAKWMPQASDDPSVWSGREADWVAKEIELSLTLPLSMEPHDRYGKSAREVIPLFVGVPMNFSQFRLLPELRPLKIHNARQIAHEMWPLQIGPLLEGIAIELGVKKRPDAEEFPKADPGKARTQPVSDQELQQVLKFDDYDGWYIDNFGNAEVRYLVKNFKFPHFVEAAEFMRLVVEYCKIVDHHPEWRNVFNSVNVSLTTWDAKRRVTIYDLNLALFMNKAFEAATSGSRRPVR